MSLLDAATPRPTTPLEHALAYLRAGWSVFPLRPGTKQPARPWAEYQHQRMSEQEVVRTWTNMPVAGVAIVTGKISDMVVIDVDPRNGGDIADAGLPTVMAWTGGGGAHYLCRYPAGVSTVPCGKTIKPGVDRKGDGGYIVAPPSIHPSGKAYEWFLAPWDTIGLSALPEWVLEQPARSVDSGTSETTERWVAETLAAPEACEPGTQEETLARLCWWAARHLEEDIAQAVLGQWLSHLPLGRRHEPWTYDHLTEKLSRAYQRRALEPGAAGPLVQDGTAPKATEATRAAALRSKLRSAKDFSENAKIEADRLDWLVKDFIAPGCWTEVIGVMKEGKSTLVCGMLRELLDGGLFLDRRCRQTKVLYVSEQVGISFKATLDRGKLGGDENLLVLTIADTFGLSWETAADTVVDLAKENECGVIVIDTLARLASLTEEDEAASVACLNPFLKARAAGIAVVFVRHGRKSGGAINVAARGSGAITGEMDICLYITAPQGVGANYRKLEGVSRLTDTIELHLEYDDGTYVLGDAPDDAHADHSVGPIVAYLTKHPTRIIGLSEIVTETKIAERTASRRLNTLIDAGTVEKIVDPATHRPGYRLLPPKQAGGLA